MTHSIGTLSFMMVGALPTILHIILSSIIHIGELDMAEVFTMDTVGIIQDIIKPEMEVALH
jgi:hypothetical protein